jgi:hypothetical protein
VNLYIEIILEVLILEVFICSNLEKIKTKHQYYITLTLILQAAITIDEIKIIAFINHIDRVILFKLLLQLFESDTIYNIKITGTFMLNVIKI